MGDEEEDLLLELMADYKTSEAVKWPKKRYAYLKFGYDKTMKAQLAIDKTTFATWINEIMTHVQSYYTHPSLPTKILFKVCK